MLSPPVRGKSSQRVKCTGWHANTAACTPSAAHCTAAQSALQTTIYAMDATRLVLPNLSATLIGSTGSGCLEPAIRHRIKSEDQSRKRSEVSCLRKHQQYSRHLPRLQEMPRRACKSSRRTQRAVNPSSSSSKMMLHPRPQDLSDHLLHSITAGPLDTVHQTNTITRLNTQWLAVV